MSRDVEKLERLGREVGSAFSRRCTEEQTGAQKASILSSLDAVRHLGLRRWRIVLIVIPAAVTAAILLVAGMYFIRGREDRFSGLDNVSLKKGGLWLEAPPGELMYLGFSDGSEVEFDALASGRIVEASREKVTIELKTGKLSASIRKGKGIRWNFSAGGYHMTVKGTQFTLAWDDRSGVLDLRVVEGKVLVTGKGIGAQGILVSAGSRLRADGKTCAVSPEAQMQQETSGPVLSNDIFPPPSTGTDLDMCDGEKAAISGQGSSSTSSTAVWKFLVDQGKFSDAMVLVRKEGLDKVIADLSLEDLWQLADAARYAEDGDGSRTILIAVRDRFGKTQKAKIAAFLLGRVAAEIDKKPSEAVAWFKVYLREDPEGPLAEEALGRLVDALMKMGRAEDAASEAKKYLEKYPEGFYAELARSAVRKGGDE